jgi:hypothetical protein
MGRYDCLVYSQKQDAKSPNSRLFFAKNCKNRRKMQKCLRIAIVLSNERPAIPSADRALVLARPDRSGPRSLFKARHSFGCRGRRLLDLWNAPVGAFQEPR